jgi:hypothetical protein
MKTIESFFLPIVSCAFLYSMFSLVLELGKYIEHNGL